MANITVRDAANVHGTNPQNLIEYIVRQKIYDSLYWKQHCFGISAEQIVDKAVDIRFVGGMFGEPQKPTEFICLLLKMLQIQPDKEIIMEYIKNDDFKYLRLLGAFYLRLTGKAVDVFNYLEPLLNDYRRIRIRNATGNFELIHIDQLIDQMLHTDYMFHISLPRLPTRHSLEKIGQLDPRISILQEEFDEEVKKEEEEEKERKKKEEEEKERAKRKKAASTRPKEKWQLGKDGDDRRHTSRQDHADRTTPASNRRSNDDNGRDRYNDRRDTRDRYNDRDRHRRDTRSRYESGSDEEGQYKREKERSREKRKDSGENQEIDGSAKESLSVEATNALRISLGLAPLK